jgi:5-formyltetrahydrofolate cyclo-ligase
MVRTEAVELRQDKASLRREFISARKAFAQNAREDVRHALSANILRLVSDLSAANSQIALYRPLPGEADFGLDPAHSYFFPIIEGEDLKFRRPSEGAAWARNALGIDEPARESSTAWSSAQPLVVFCPAVAVDWQGNRLGMGKGFYDRFFQQHPACIRVGVIFQIQLTKTQLPADNWDQLLDWVVTEKMILRTSSVRRSF